MLSIYRILSKPLLLCVHQNCESLISTPKKRIINPLAAFSSDKCDSGKKGSDSGSSKDGGDGPCQPCGPWCCPPCPPPGPPCDIDTSGSNVYDKRKFGHNLPQNNVNVPFEPIPQIPTGVFRNTDCETLGLGAGKCGFYKNPEYFAFHHMSYYDMHLIMRCYRRPSPDTKRKP